MREAVEKRSNSVLEKLSTFLKTSRRRSRARPAAVRAEKRPTATVQAPESSESSSITPPDAVARIVSIGRAHKIPVVVSATSGGNDGSQFSRYGAIVAPLSWPGRYSHSPVEVMDLREASHLVLGFHMVWPFRSARWAEPSPPISQRATWSFVLRPSSGGATRLLVRSRAASRPRWLWAPWDAFFRLAHVPMQRKQLLGIRRRADFPPVGSRCCWIQSTASVDSAAME